MMILDINRNILTEDGKSVPLTRMHVSILMALFRAYPAQVLYSDMISAVYAEDEPDDPLNSIRVTIAKLRGLMARAGMKPIVVTRWGTGFLADRVPDNVDKVLALTRPSSMSAELLEDIAGLLETHPNTLLAASVLKRLPAIT